MTEEPVVGILGLGQVGSALHRIYKNKNIPVKISDQVFGGDLPDLEILNICIPYSEKFIDIVTEHVFYSKAKITIIHSTVPPGTTSQIQKFFNNQYIVHSPVRGIHPELYEGLKTFIKYIGADIFEAAKTTQEHFNALGITSHICANSTTTELAKLLCTTYYGLCIAWHHDMKTLCDKHGVPFNEIINWNNTYNSGYNELGMSHVNRPVLYPPHGKIDGTCIIPNTELLSNIYQSKALDYILQFK
jgi:UDP-N-acetyl-D-mannosaminuronate dehydrogenase